MDIPLLISNIGAPQLLGEYGLEGACKAREMINADIIAIHLNYLQEIIQPEGELASRGLWDALYGLAKITQVILKETGFGMTNTTACKAKSVGAVGVDVGGLGGTSFTRVEGYRAHILGHESKERLGKLFENWGIPTPVSVLECKPFLPSIATGGIRNGFDVAKALVIGASAVGIGHEFLKAASESYEVLDFRIKNIIEELKCTMFLTSTRTIKDFSECRWFAKRDLTQWIKGLNLATKKNAVVSASLMRTAKRRSI